MTGSHLHKKKIFFQVGLHVAARHPDLYDEIVKKYLHVDAIDDDLGNVPGYYKLFCEYLSADNFFPASEKPLELFTKRRFFVSLMLRVYAPGVHNQRNEDITICKSGFVRAVAKAIGLGEPSVSKIIRLVIAHERIYADYKAGVDKLVSMALSATKAKAC